MTERMGLSHTAEAVSVALLCISAVVAPLALGATGEWPRVGLDATAVLAIGLWGLSSKRSPWALFLPMLVAAVTTLQLLPLSDRLLVAIAPISAGAWKLAHQGLPGAWGRISVDPATTAAEGRRLLIGLATVAAVADLARIPLYRRLLIGAIATAAIAIICAGILFPVVRTERIMLGFIDLKGPIEWWRTPLAFPSQSGGWAYLEKVCVDDQCYQSDLALVGDAYGSYICCNKFAGAVCLTLPVALAAWLFLTRRRMPAIVASLASWAVIAGVGWIVGVRISSRAGLVSLVLAVLVLQAISAERRLLRRAFTLMAIAYAALLVGFVVVFLGQVHGIANLFPEPWQPRIAAVLADGRVVASNVAWRMFLASPVLGTGLGTYGEIFPRILPMSSTMYYAHNDYAQLLAEAGLVGLAFAVWFGIVLARRFARFYREAKFPERILDAGPWAAVAGILAHSAFDWNLHIPANAFLSCLNIGLAIASVPSVVKSSSGSSSIPPGTWSGRTSAVGAGLLVATCFGSLVMLARDAYADSVKRRLLEAIVADRIAAQNPTQRPATAQLLAARASGEAASRWAPSDARLNVLVGQVDLHLAGHAKSRDPAVPESQDSYLAAAEAEFRRAKLNSPTCRGLAEKDPAKAKSRTP